MARNQVRRRLRHAVTLLAGEFPPGDLLLRVSGAAEQCSWPVVFTAVADLSRRLGGAFAGGAAVDGGLDVGDGGVVRVRTAAAGVDLAPVVVVSATCNDPLGL